MRERVHTARKRFGQHFLIDRGVVRAIVAAIDPAPADRIVEIGPGLGALTIALLERVPHLDVIELDRDLAARLASAWPPERLTVHCGDALRFDFSALGPGLRVAGNLPYNISTPLLFCIAAHAPSIRDAIFMLQKEVVERMVAAPGSRVYGRLSVSVQCRFELEELFEVGPEAFRPPPKVRSAVVRMVPRPALAQAVRDETAFARILAAAFGQRRKTLRNSLRKELPESALVELGIDPGLRAEDLPVGDFVRLANRAALPPPG
ncbi:MAG: 16S rRNA (adenine(1518)-N(6)/adenine(1519)-N(6)) -dimethyltransferase RsmA [Rhodocyclaceae bacterium]